ncbi:hypothetical protein, partial [Acinetobacter baumannii]
CSSWYQAADGKNFSLWPTYTWKYWLDTRKVNPKDRDGSVNLNNSYK